MLFLGKMLKAKRALLQPMAEAALAPEESPLPAPESPIAPEEPVYAAEAPELEAPGPVYVAEEVPEAPEPVYVAEEPVYSRQEAWAIPSAPEEPLPRIMIVGTGGVGGFLAATLAACAEVTVIARGAHLAAIREHGLTLEDADRTFTIRPALATDDPAEAGVQDVVFLATKSYGLLEATEAARPAIGPYTLVIPLQNGVDSAKRIADLLPPCLPCEGCIYVFSRISAPGVITRTGSFGRIAFGSARPEAQPGLQALAALIEGQGFPASVSADIRRELWIKWAFICGNAQATAYYDCTVGEMRESPEAMGFLGGLIEELLAVGQAEGVDLPLDLKEQVFANVMSQPYEARSSLARDIDVPGGPTELDQFAGALCRMAERHGIPVPCNARIRARFGDRF